MAHAGAVIENPVVGDRIIFLRTTADTAGELLEFDLFARPGAAGPPEHVHPQATERFEVKQGVLRARVAGIEKTIEAGQSLVIPAGTLHSWWNSGTAEVAGARSAHAGGSQRVLSRNDLRPRFVGPDQ